MQDKDWEEMGLILTKDFGGEAPSLFSLEELRKFVIREMNIFLDSDMQGLLNLMYRLDIDESEFKKTLSTVPVPELAGTLADIIIRREIKKLEFRKKYR